MYTLQISKDECLHALSPLLLLLAFFDGPESRMTPPLHEATSGATTPTLGLVLIVTVFAHRVMDIAVTGSLSSCVVF